MFDVCECIWCSQGFSDDLSLSLLHECEKTQVAVFKSKNHYMIRRQASKAAFGLISCSFAFMEPENIGLRWDRSGYAWLIST